MFGWWIYGVKGRDDIGTLLLERIEAFPQGLKGKL